MGPTTKIILTIIFTFALALATSLLLEIPIFQHPVRYVLVISFMAIEIYFGYLIYKFLITKT